MEEALANLFENDGDSGVDRNNNADEEAFAEEGSGLVIDGSQEWSDVSSDEERGEEENEDFKGFDFETNVIPLSDDAEVNLLLM